MRLAAIAAAALGLCAFGAQAQSKFDPREGFNPQISDDIVVTLTTAVLDRMARLYCGAAPCAEATEAERRSGLISRRDAREIIRKGLLSQVGECAGIDWRRVGFEPMMANWRNDRRASDRQLAFVGALHGAGMGLALNSMGGSCPKR